jgi:hypothetical protein
VWQHVRYAIRLVRREPGASLAAMVLIALGIAVTTMFSVKSL